MTDLDRLRRYALGAIPEPEAEELEQRLLVDEELHQQLESVEDALVEDYLGGALAGEERALFEARRARDARLAEHVRHAALLRERFTSAGPAAARRGARLARYWPALAALLLLAAAALLWRSRAPVAPPLGQDARTVPAPSPSGAPASPSASPGATEPPAPAIASLTLSPGQTMSEDAGASMVLAPSIQTLRLELVLEGASAASYKVEIVSEDGRRVLGHDGARPDPDQRVLMVEVPAARLPAGRYRLELTPQGGRPAGARPYYFELLR